MVPTGIPPTRTWTTATPGTLKTWRAAGAGPKYHGRHRFVRYKVADLDAFVLNGGSRSEPG